jgi:hypothetical protein
VPQAFSLNPWASVGYPVLAWILLIAAVVLVALSTKNPARRRTAATILRLLVRGRRR